MNSWTRPDKVTYRRWRNPDFMGEVNFVDQSDEYQYTGNDICPAGSGRLDSQEGYSASKSRSDKTEETLRVDDVLDTIGFGKFQWKLSLLTGLAWIGDAMEMMILSILGPQLHCEWRLPSYQVALITSVVFIGTGITSPVWGKISDKYGRRVGLITSICWILFYGLLSAFAPVYGWLLVLRGLVGAGIGGCPQGMTLYSEFLPMKMRGTCIMMMSIFWSVGAIFVVFLALWTMPTLGWRWLLIFSIIPLAIFICFCKWLPESPRFDLLTGNTEKAMATLQLIAKENGKTMPEGKVITHKQKERGQIKDLLSPQYRRTTLLLWFIWFSIAFNYYGLVLLTTELYQSGDPCGATQGAKTEPSCNLECNYLTSDDYKDLLWTTLAEVPGVLVFLLIIDRVGRRKSIAACFFMFSLFILPLYACIGRVAVIIFIFTARAFITGGFQVVCVYTPEVFPTETRALAIGICSAISRVGSLLTPFIAQVILRKSLSLTLFLYCGCSLLAGVASLFLPIETSGRSLQESSLNQKA
ncbi:synaptic vesicle 2-related protein-like isoform X2 [Antennarius striatus]|uniref:synaptic vesicle 2-related protein-like isoform X2 n=1 Tax=Antennarius striatus TaxID=241820 RepID=UPI0035B41B05